MEAVRSDGHDWFPSLPFTRFHGFRAVYVSNSPVVLKQKQFVLNHVFTFTRLQLQCNLMIILSVNTKILGSLFIYSSCNIKTYL